MTISTSRRRLLAASCGLTFGALAGCTESEDGHTTYDIENQRSEGVAIDFRMYTMGELVIAREYELGADETRREENALAGTEFEVEVTVDDETATYDLEQKGCDDQELRIRIQDEEVVFDSNDCE